jgi:PAS domain S-box-containing protein
LEGKIINYEIDLLRKDGRSVPVTVSSNLIKNEQGKPVYIEGIIHDITEIKKSEKITQENIKKFETYTAKAPLGIFVCNEKGNYLDANPMATQMSGYTKEELIKINVKDFLSPDNLTEGLKAFNEVLKNGYSQAEVKVRKKNGEIFWINLISAKIDNNQLIAFCVDISERKKTQQRIEELNEIRNKFIEIVSHQLRTPLTAVNWNLEMLLSGDFGKLEETQRKFLQITHRSSIEITQRIHNLLAAMDIEEGRTRLVTTEVSINSICAETVNEMQKEAEIKNISLVYTPSLLTFPIIYGDGEKIRTAVHILIKNSVNYTKENGKINITLQLINNTVRFEVIDTGVGIPAEEQHLIFGRFYRASNASVMLPDGFGIGLFIAKNYIEQHHGKIGFISKENVGSTFWFEVPVRE